MRTTIQVHEALKQEIQSFREHSRETYEDILKRLIQMVRLQETSKNKDLVSGYEEMAEDSKKIAKVWAVTETDLENAN